MSLECGDPDKVAVHGHQRRELLLLIFGLLLGRNLAHRTHGSYRTQRRTFPIEERLRAGAGPADRAVGQQQTILHVEKTVAGRVQRSLDGRPDSLAVFGVDALDESLQRHGVIGADAVDFPVAWGRINGVGEVIVVENADVGDANRLLEPGLAFAQGRLHALPLRDIQHDAVLPVRTAGVGVKETALAENPVLASIRPTNAHLLRENSCPNRRPPARPAEA